MSRNQNDQDYKAIAEVCTGWWRALRSLNGAGEPIQLGNGSPKAPDRAALAELRRLGVIELGGAPAVDIGQALSSSAFLKLFADLRGAPISEKSRVRRWLYGGQPCLEPFAIAAATLAHIRSDAGGKGRGATARLLGAPRSEGGASEDRLFAEPRFKRLIRTNDWPGLLAQARRIAAILERQAPIGDLGASLILWNADPGIVRDWAFQYYRRNYESPSPAHETAPVGAAV